MSDEPTTKKDKRTIAAIESRKREDAEVRKRQAALESAQRKLRAQRLEEREAARTEQAKERELAEEAARILIARHEAEAQQDILDREEARAKKAADRASFLEGERKSKAEKLRASKPAVKGPA